MNQIVLGASIPFGIAVLIYLLRRGHAGLPTLILTPFFVFLGAVYAVVPDLPRLIGRHDIYRKWAAEPRMDIFLFHYSIDQAETDSPYWVLPFLGMLGCILFAAWRELRRAETGRR